MVQGVNPDTGKHYRFKDRTGERSGRLVFVRCLGENKHRHTMWEAVCDCGATTITTQPHRTKSCGCLRRELASERAKSRALAPSKKQENIRLNRANQRAKRKLDPVKSMQARLSRLHRHAISQVGAIKTSPTFESLGYTADEFKNHIEKQLLKGMGWHNMNLWQIDHITPISTAKTIDDVISLNQLWNLRPMWSVENNRKKDKMESLL